LSAAKKLMMVAGVDWQTLPFGTAIEGGFYAGMMRYSDGDYALIVAPKSAETSLAQKTTDSATSGTQSYHDGLANCGVMNNSTHPATQYCRAYAGGGYLDWYLPARDELELLYRRLKPSTTSNYVSTRGDGGYQGQNANSVPIGPAYTASSPAQTLAADFRTGGAQSLGGSGVYYWSSTEFATNTRSAWIQSADNGLQTNDLKFATNRVRPVRRVKI